MCIFASSKFPLMHKNPRYSYNKYMQWFVRIENKFNVLKKKQLNREIEKQLVRFSFPNIMFLFMK